MAKPVDLAKLRSISITSAAAPTRTGASRVQQINERDAQQAKDIDAYKRLRKNGLQPPQIDGSAKRELADESWIVEERPPDWQFEQAGNMGVDVAG